MANPLDLLTSPGASVHARDIDGVTFYLKKLTAAERLDWMRTIGPKGLSPESSAGALVRSVCDEAGQLLLKAEHVADMLASSNQYFAPLLSWFLDLNHLANDTTDEKKSN